MLHRRALLTSTMGGAILAGFGQVERLVLALAPATKEEVPWLAEIQTPPAKLPADAPRLEPLCRRQDGKAITTREDWGTRRAELLDQWSEFLGPMPAERKEAPKLEVIEEDRPEGQRR